ncbi:hypothetical protein [Microcoleus phage My-WqHQDG]|nr:hypothetical protein [Microcoleus phage My-WqHQDG]
MSMDSVLYPVKLPSGREVEIRQFTFEDRVYLAKQYQAYAGNNPREQGYTLEELMAAASIVKINGVPVVDEMGNQVEFGMDPIQHFMSWDPKEVQYFLELFMTIAFIDDKLRAQAQQQAKELMASMATPQVPGGKRSPARAATTMP